MRRRGRDRYRPAQARLAEQRNREFDVDAWIAALEQKQERSPKGEAVRFVDEQTGETRWARPMSVAPVLGAGGEIVGYSMMWAVER